MWRLTAAILSLSTQVAVTSIRRPKVAVIIAGHARTYDLTAKSVHEKLIGLKANDHWEFTVFALAYSIRDRKRGGDKSKRTRYSEKASTVTPANLRAVYRNASGVRIHARVIEENFIKTQRRLRISMMFRTIAEAHTMVKAQEVASRQPFALIVKLRFDLKLLAPFALKAECFESAKKQLSVVVPTQMDRGPSHLSPRHIRTRPCNKNGTDRPTWMQDHIAYGPSSAMSYYLNGTDMFMRAGARGMASPEVILAHFMERSKVLIKCDNSIRYTIIR